MCIHFIVLYYIDYKERFEYVDDVMAVIDN